MPVKTEHIALNTKGFTEVIDITSAVGKAVKESGLDNGIVTIFHPGSTAGITTIEHEPGLLKDLPEMLEKITPTNVHYHHNDTWGDGNGYAHLRSALIKTSLTVPFVKGKLTLGTWQQIVFIDFDNRPRRRKLVCQLIGE